MRENSKTIIITAIILTAFCSLFLLIYLWLLPFLVSNAGVIDFVEKKVKQVANVDLTIQKPKLITGFNTKIGLKAGKIEIKDKNDELLNIKNLDTEISLKKLCRQKFVLNRCFVDYIFADIDKLMALSTEKEEKKSAGKWSVDFYNADFCLKEGIVIYSPIKNTQIKINAKNIFIENKEEDNKLIHFNIDALVKRSNTKIKFDIRDNGKVSIREKKLYIDNIVLNLNDSDINLIVSASEKDGLSLNIFSKEFQVKDISNLVISNLVLEDGDELMSYFGGFKGSIDFNIQYVKNKLSGLVYVHNARTKIIPLKNLPVTIQRGTVKITPDDVFFDKFDGYYGNTSLNRLSFSGKIRDYNKICETDIMVKSSLTNDLAKNYLTPISGIPLEIMGRIGVMVKLTCLADKIDIWMGGKLAKENDILVDGASLTPNHYDRAFTTDLHFKNNILNIEDISYYIAKDIYRGVKIKPIMNFKGNIDCSKQIPELMNFGLKIPNPLPSEFLNLFAGPKFFKGGQFIGNIEIVNMQNVPTINGNFEAEKIRIPSQRLYVKKAELYTDKNLIHIVSKGSFKRTKYDFNGEILNEIKFPIVVKNVLLSVDNMDLERILRSFNTQNTDNQTMENTAQIITTDEEEMEDDGYVFDVNNLIIENCCFKLKSGSYKDIKFGNLDSTLTLNKNNILELKSNKFDIAEGTSGLKVFCDFNKHKYWLKLGIKDVNSDLISTALLNLPREISGKARGFIDLHADESLKMNGSIKFSINDGQIQKIGLVEYLLKFASIFRNPVTMITPSILSDIVNIPEGNFKKIKGELIIKNNNVRHMKIQSTSEKLSALIRGRYNIETGDASLRIYTKFSTSHQGWGGFVRNFSLNSLANKISFSNKSSSNYYASELEQIPQLETGEDEAQVFLTTVDGDIVNFNFISSLKKIK